MSPNLNQNWKCKFSSAASQGWRGIKKFALVVERTIILTATVISILAWMGVTYKGVRDGAVHEKGVVAERQLAQNRIPTMYFL